MNSPSARAAALLSLGLGACAGTVVLDLQVTADVSGEDSTGRVWRAAASELTTVPPSPGMATPFGAPLYRGPYLQWQFSIGSGGIGGELKNVSSTDICLRFDNATLSSNKSSSGKQFVVYAMRTLDDPRGTWNLIGDLRARKPFVPSAMCLDPGQTKWVSFNPVLLDIFPSGHMFDVTWLADKPEVTSSGRGNWVNLRVPVERGGQRESLNIRLTAVDARARTSYF